MLRKVMMILEQMSMNERMREFARVRERGMRDYLSGIEHSYHEGKEEGKEEGIVEGVEKTARSMLSKGLPDLMIAEVTGLSLERIYQMKERS
jgi:predicted transposase/invertase (TIGR01784 family)